MSKERGKRIRDRVDFHVTRPDSSGFPCPSKEREPVHPIIVIGSCVASVSPRWALSFTVRRKMQISVCALWLVVAKEANG